ncbi:PREDICTED: P-selectin-like [Branchiostoma belcheri]|uniref:P-selectin-like n=1 Tax=Branchiostoma belcheri TaxID=7741 RepID=A0A6P4ZM69_BRABE|nr:PREDICTED: P-selectin-like [Branchiostoma belcheri]
MGSLQCRTLTAPANGFLSPVGANSYQDVVTFTCDQGYKLGGASSVTCQADRTWSAPVPTCQPLQCPTLTAPANGFLSPVGANSYQDVVTFTCDQGYGLDGASSVRCQADRTWSAPVPTCYPLQCRTLMAPANGALSPVGANSYQDVVTFTCDQGYGLDGAYSVRCQAGQTWSAPVPTCQPLQCPTLTAPANGFLSPVEANSYQDVVTFTCDQGYGLNGASSVTCQADRTWSAPVPTCYLFARVNVSLMLTAPRHVNLSLLRDPIRQSLEQAGGFCGDQCKIGEIFLHVVSDTNGARKRRQAGDQVLINVIIQLIVVVNQQQGTGDTTDATVTAENLLQQNAYALRQLARSGQLSVDIGGEHIRLVDSSDSSSNCPSGQYKSNGNCGKW